MTWVDWFFLGATTLCGIGSIVTFRLYVRKERQTEQRKKQRVQNFARSLDGSRSVRIIRGAAPKTGTILTPERMAENLRSLNQPWEKEKE